MKSTKQKWYQIDQLDTILVLTFLLMLLIGFEFGQLIR